MNPDARIRLIRGSLRVFTWGVISVLPLIGFIPGILTIVTGPQLLAQSRREWNPALVYLRCGLALGILTFGISIIAFLILLLNLLPPLFGAS